MKIYFAGSEGRRQEHRMIDAGVRHRLVSFAAGATSIDRAMRMRSMSPAERQAMDRRSAERGQVRLRKRRERERTLAKYWRIPLTLEKVPGARKHAHIRKFDRSVRQILMRQTIPADEARHIKKLCAAVLKHLADTPPPHRPRSR
jgi:hypothetical protein